MSHLFFLDESGHDGKTTPYEVNGGILVPVSKAWPLIQDINAVEEEFFGCRLRDIEVETKGANLLRKRIFTYARETEPLDPHDRTLLAKAFLEKGKALKGKSDVERASLPKQTKQERWAYAQACIAFVECVFQLCHNYDVKVFACIIPHNIPQPESTDMQIMLRKDLVYVLQRVYDYMQTRPSEARAVIVFDAKDDLGSPICHEGERLNFVLERYYTGARVGKLRATRILPEPLYVRSDLTKLVGVADIAIYTINHCFRRARAMSEPARDELQHILEWIVKLRYTYPRPHGMMHSLFYLSDLRGKSQK